MAALIFDVCDMVYLIYDTDSIALNELMVKVKPLQGANP
jgi:hypothetical protein